MYGLLAHCYYIIALLYAPVKWHDGHAQYSIIRMKIIIIIVMATVTITGIHDIVQSMIIQRNEVSWHKLASTEACIVIPNDWF